MAGTATVSVSVSASGLVTGAKTFANTATVATPVDDTQPVLLTHNSANSITPPSGATFAIISFPSTASGPYNFGTSALEPSFPITSVMVIPLQDADVFNIFNQHNATDATATILWM
jgi:hypothetical protein